MLLRHHGCRYLSMRRSYCTILLEKSATCLKKIVGTIELTLKSSKENVQARKRPKGIPKIDSK